MLGRGARGRAVGLSLAVAALGAGCGAGERTPADRPAAAGPSAVAFAFGGRIHVMRPDGSGRVRLTGGRFPREAVVDYEPAWSPDASTLAFARVIESRSGDGSIGIYLVDAAGGPVRRVAVAGDVFWPAWSPDGTRIAFVRSIDGKDSEEVQIVVAGLDGGGERVLFSERADNDESIYVSETAWSPDGAQIAFTRTTLDRQRHLRPSLYVMQADGSNVRVLARDAASPAWSPDGRRIAFSSVRDRNGKRCYELCILMGELYAMDADGTDPVRLTRNRGDDRSPSWSPDGARIVFASDRNRPGASNYELYSIGADGSCLTWLTNGSPESSEPAWSGGLGGGTCEARRRPRAIVEVRPVRPAGGRAYWLGESYRGLLLDNSQGGRDRRGRSHSFFHYGDCGRYHSRDCAPELQMQEVSVCSRSGESTLPVLDDADYRHRVRSYAAHGLLFVDIGQWDLSAVIGATHVRLFPGVGGAKGLRFAERALRALRPVGGRAGPLPRPALPATLLLELDRAKRAYAASGSVTGAARALGVARLLVRRRLDFARAVDSLPRVKAVDCR